MEFVTFTWWLWMLLGIVLLAGEVLTPGGFYIFFFGASALCVGLLKLLGFTQGFASEGVLFAGLAIAGVAFFRKPLVQHFQPLATPPAAVDDLTTEIAVALADIAPGALGKVELRGASWNALNDGPAPIPKAARCRVVRVDGLTLHIRAL